MGSRERARAHLCARAHACSGPRILSLGPRRCTGGPWRGSGRGSGPWRGRRCTAAPLCSVLLVGEHRRPESASRVSCRGSGSQATRCPPRVSWGGLAARWETWNGEGAGFLSSRDTLSLSLFLSSPLSLSLSFPLSPCTRTGTHAHARARTGTHVRARECTQALTRTHGLRAESLEF